MLNPNTGRTIQLDDRNLRFIDGIGMLLMPGDPDYTPYPGERVTPPHKPHRRPRLSPQDLTNLNIQPTNTTHHMDTDFHFNVLPLPSGGNTTRVVFQDDLATPELTAKIKADLEARGITLTEEQIAATGEAMARIIIVEGMAKSRPVRRAFGYLTWEPACGGKHESPDFSPTPENMNATGNGRLAPQGQALFDTTVTFHREAVLGARTPVVTRIFDGSMRECECITLGGPFRLSGPRAFGPDPDPANAALGIFLKRAGADPVRIAAFSDWSDSEIFGSWPAAIPGTGDVELSVATLYPRNAHPSIFKYGKSLPIMP